FLCLLCFFFFFFQAEDGIRDYKVTGVQTCALPISRGRAGYRLGALRRSAVQGARSLPRSPRSSSFFTRRADPGRCAAPPRRLKRSEERRVGKECRSRGWAYDMKKKKELEI